MHLYTKFQVSSSTRFGDMLTRANYQIHCSAHIKGQQESRAVARKPRDAAAVLFGLKFVNDIHYKFKTSQASKARLQSSKHTGTKQNLTQNGNSRSFKVTCFGVSGKAIMH